MGNGTLIGSSGQATRGQVLHAEGGEASEDSFSAGLLDYPCYSRPLDVEGHEVPPVLRSGHHDKIRRWRLERAVEATVTRRPDLIKKNWKKYPAEVRRLVRRYGLELSEAAEKAAQTEESS